MIRRIPRLAPGRAAAFAVAPLLSVAAPVAAQFEVAYPSDPPEEGQTVLEWADPPVLRYTIPEDRRGDLSTCDAPSEFDLDKTALTCWPVLEALQLFTRADFARGEPTGDKAENQRMAIAYADEALALIGEPQWPLHELLRTRSLEVRLSAQTRLARWEEALETSADLIASIRGEMIGYDDFRLGFAQAKRTDLLLQLGRVEEARANLEEARALLAGGDGEKVGWPFSNHSETIISHAIKQGDLAYAERMTDAYLDHLADVTEGMQFGIIDHLDLKLYLVSARGDAAEALRVLDKRIVEDDSYRKCSHSKYQFPLVMAPLRKDTSIMARLREAGCTDETLAELGEVAQTGIRARSGEIVLPYPNGAQ